MSRRGDRGDGSGGAGQGRFGGAMKCHSGAIWSGCGHEDLIFLGTVGVGKTFLAGALGHAACTCRAGHGVLFLRADRMFQLLHQSRADHSTEKAFRRLLAPDLLILDDFGLRRLTAEQASDLYEVILERHRRASTIVTSNRAIERVDPALRRPDPRPERPRPARPQRLPGRDRR